MKRLLPTTLLASLLLLGAGCTQNTTVVVTPTPAPNNNEPNTQTITYLESSSSNSTAYCDGANMDSEGYRKTITKEINAVIPATNDTATLAKLITLELFPEGNFHNVFSSGNFTFENGILTVPSPDGWAGVSIALCTVQPLVEVNMLRLPGVTKVVWGLPNAQ